MIPLLTSLLSLGACTEAPSDPHDEAWATVLADPDARAELRGPGVDLRASLADAIFAGRGVDVVPPDSDPVEDARPVPFTFVTWQVERSWKGLDAGDRFTARFMGGRSSEGDVLTGSEQPLFLLGDRDVVFVDSQLDGACPLVGCAAGRYRLVDGRVYGNDGETLNVSDTGELRRVGARDLAELHVFDLGGELLETPQTGDAAVGADSDDDGTFFRWLDQRLRAETGRVSPRSARLDDPLVAPVAR